MFLEKIELENWKCFKRKTVQFSKQNIINLKNGSGKTSIFEGIVFGLYGKRPSGLDYNDLRLDRSKDAKVVVSFSVRNLDFYEVSRAFGRNSHVIVKKNDQIICSNNADAFGVIDEIFPWSIASVVWAPSTLTSSKILDPNFIINNVFEHIFKDPRAIEAYYKREILAQNKIVKNLKMKLGNTKYSNSDIEKVRNEISQLKIKLKEKSSSSNTQIAKAKNSQSAQLDLNKLYSENKKFMQSSFELLSNMVCMEYISTLGQRDPEKYIEKLQEALDQEMAKSNHPITKIQKSVVDYAIQESKSSSECIFCKSQTNDSTFDWIEEIFKSEKMDTSRIEKISKALKSLSYDRKSVEISKMIHDLNSKIAECPNWKEIIEKYDEENEKLWANLEDLERKERVISESIKNQLEYIEESKKLADLQEKSKVPSKYIEEASEYYMYSITEKASDILRELNGRYDNLFLDGQTSTYNVAVLSEQLESLNILNVMLLSGGEKTLVGACLIFAACEVFFNNVPLLFDESFAALDQENLNSLKEYFKSIKHQVLVITHNNTWTVDN